jgi:hypothetical protein
MMEKIFTSEISVHFNVTTWCYAPEDSKHHKAYQKDNIIFSQFSSASSLGHFGLASLRQQNQATAQFGKDPA